MLATCAAFALIAWYWHDGADEAPAAAAPVAHDWNTPVGPGLVAGAPAAPATSPAAAPAPSALKLDAGGHLLIDGELRRVFDAYLPRANPAVRAAGAASLRQFLQSSLTGPALADANNAVARYLNYLDELDQRLARERFAWPANGWTAPDAQHLLAWQAQRAGLRARLLGTVWTQAWFEADDARCGGVLRAWLPPEGVGGEPPAEPDSNTLRERRLHGPMLDERRDADTRACALDLANIAPGANN